MQHMTIVYVPRAAPCVAFAVSQRIGETGWNNDSVFTANQQPRRYDPVHNKHYLRWTWHAQGKDNYIEPIVIKVKCHHGECCQAQAQPSSRQKIIKRRYCHGNCERKNDIRAEAQTLCFWSMLQLYSPCVFDSRWQERLLDMLCWPLFLVPLLSNMVLCSLMLVSHQILLTLGWFNCVRIPKHFQVFDAVSPIPEQMDNKPFACSHCECDAAARRNVAHGTHSKIKTPLLVSKNVGK